MAEDTREVKRTEKVRGQDITGKVMVLAKTHPQQLILFQTFLPEEDPDDQYSNTIELYDAIPKHFSNPKQMDAMREGGKYLPILERVFRHRQETYTVQIHPARIKDRHGDEKEYYPTPREELLEDALRKIACDRLNGIYLDNMAGVQFTLYELHKELKRRGHDIKFWSLIESLTICHHAGLTLCNASGHVVLKSPIFPILLLSSRQDWVRQPKEARCYVQFNPLITHCISQLSYRQFNYGACMAYTHRLTRWFHKRLAHNYTQAGVINPYSIKMSTILRDSGTYQSPRPHDNVRRIDEALDELKADNVLQSTTAEVQRGPRNSIVDVKYTLYPTLEFIHEVKKANRRMSKLCELLPRNVGDVNGSRSSS